MSGSKIFAGCGEKECHCDHGSVVVFGEGGPKGDQTVSSEDYVHLSADSRAGIVNHLQEELIGGIQALRKVTGSSQLDLLEVCAPWDSPLCEAVREGGGTAVAIGLHNGFDMSTRSGFRKAVTLVRRLKPRYMHVSPPCFPWSPFQNLNQKSVQQREDLQVKRQVHRRLLHFCRRLVQIQVKELNQDCGCVEQGP